MNIVIDTREKRPYEFENAVRKALPAGDYSIEGCETQIAIERKTLSDWISTVVHNRLRFARELEKLQNYAYAAVVIEASVVDILSGCYISQIKPAALWALTCSIILKYRPVQVLFAHDRAGAKTLTKTLLTKFGEKYAS